jgi:hypothetical protein
MPRKRKKVLSDVLASGNTSKEQFKQLGPASLQIDDLSNRLENQKTILKDSNFNVSSDFPRMNSELDDISKKQKKAKEDIQNYNKSGALKKAIERNRFVKSKVREAENNEEIKSILSEPKKTVEKEEAKQGSALVNATNKTQTTESPKPNILPIEKENAYSFPKDAVDESGFGQPKDSMEQTQAYTFPKEAGDDSGFGKAKDTSKTLPMEKINAYSFSEQPVDESAFDPIKTGETLVNAMATDVTNTVTDKAILDQIQNAESPEEIAKIKADAEAAKIEEQKQKEQLANQNSALLNTIHEINHGQQGQRDSFDKIATIEDVQRGVLDQYRNQASNVPYAVVEKLGIQDYYPNAGRDIAVGTFSGSRIGSQTIYSGAGALLPMGLYDARKRSLVEAAKSAQKKKDEFLQVPDAPQQFNADFQQAAYSELYDIGAKHGWNMNAIMKDKEAMQRVYSIKNAAKDLAYTDAIVNNIFETLNTADGKTASYVPEDVLQKMIEYRQGKLDVDAVLSGKNNVLELAGEIRNYANGTAWADKNLAEWKSDPVSLPLNLKTDKEITMDNLNEINQTIEKAKVSGSYDSYITAVKKYFHLDPKVVDAWVDQNMVGATPDQKQKVVDDLNTYILAQMPPESIEEKIDNLKNDNYNYWAKRQDLARYDKERETIMTRAINTANENKLKDRISAINNDTSLNSPEKKAAALSKAYRDAGFTPNYNKKTGEVYGVVKYTAADKKMNVVYPSNTTQVWVQKSQKAGGGMAWVNISTVLANQGNYKLTSDQKTELTEFQKGGARGSINESRMYETYVDDNGYTRKVGTNNLDKYSKTTREKKGIGTETVGNVVIASADKDGNVTYKPGTMQIRAQFNPETNPTDRDALDAMFADEKQKLSTDPTFNAGGPSSNF